MRHPDFRVNGRIFATLGYPNSDCGMVKLTAEQQEKFIRTEPSAFSPVKGSWGVRGYTSVCLKATKVALLREAMIAAWRNAAPKGMAEQLGSRR